MFKLDLQRFKSKSFCNCVEGRSFENRLGSSGPSHIDDFVFSCNCGEVSHAPAWGWSEEESSVSVEVSENNQVATFHQDYSNGNACVKGDTAFTDDNHYYWEIKLIRPVFGTSVMIGVGTKNVDVNKYGNVFCHLLGDDDESWGMTYYGRLYHKKKAYSYHEEAGFVAGSIVGVHLDMWHGTLEFFMNRQPLGIAFTGLRGKVLYPMASSTASKIIMKLIYSGAKPHSLAFTALRHLTMPAILDLPFGLKKEAYESWWHFPKSSNTSSKKEEEIEKGFDKALYVLIDSDDDEDQNEGDRALVQRMKRVLENSAACTGKFKFKRVKK